MKKAENFLFVSASIALLAFTLTFTNLGPTITQAAATMMVKVINTPAEPVPTAAQGTTTVGGTVGISGTPTVGLAGGSSVLVDNNAANAIPVRDVDNPAWHSFQASATGVASAGDSWSCETGPLTLATVPFAKRLVIEYVSFSGNLPTGQRFLDVWVISNGTRHYLPVALQGTTFGGTIDFFAASQPVRLYAASQTDVVVCFNRNSVTGSGFASFTISGYLVDAP